MSKKQNLVLALVRFVPIALKLVVEIVASDFAAQPSRYQQVF